MKVRCLIVGAGPSGLSLAKWLQDKGYECLIIEAGGQVGGLCSSMVSAGGAVFDVGGHSFHTTYHRAAQLVEEVMEPYGGMYWQKRDARVYFNGQVLPYPFQQHAHLIEDDRIRMECEAPNFSYGEPSNNFLDYLLHKFNPGICEHFMLPYNNKIWKYPLSGMAADWAGQRVASTKEESFENAKDRIALQPSTMVGYPKYHPFQQIFKALAERLEPGTIRYNTKLMAIDYKNRICNFETYGQNYDIEYDELFLTIPMTTYMDMMSNLHRKLEYIADGLKFLSLNLVNVEASYYNWENVPQRLYCAGDEVAAHKIAFNNRSSEFWQDTGTMSVMAEVSMPGKLIDADGGQTNSWSVLSFLDKIGIVTMETVVRYHELNIRYGYPIYTLNRDEIVNTVLAELSKHGIYGLGRFGAWRYVNSDSCIEEAIALAESLHS